MPPNRSKIIHPTGVVGLFKLDVTHPNNPYTGSFKGTDYGVFRISEVGSVGEEHVPSTSMGLKFLRDGVDAGNIFSLHAFEGHPDTYNFLKPVYNTHVTIPTNECNLMTSHAKLSQVSKHVGNMSVKGLADYDQYGNKEAEQNWPFKCEFRPNDPCNSPDEWTESYLNQLTTGCIPVNYNLFEMWCQEGPEAEGYEMEQLGNIVTTSDVVTSMYGDTKLFFRHVRFEEDLEERPHWKEHVEMFTRNTFVDNLPLPYDAPASCPFDYLFGLI